MNLKIRKYLLPIISFIYLFCSILHANKYNEIITKVFSDRKIESIEGIWIKTLANQGPNGCITMFYKDQEQYYQIHIDECYVMGKITGKQKKINENYYEGENAIYFYDSEVIWEPSNITISDDLNNFSITHGNLNNKFVEKWKRIWPINLNNYNNKIK